MNAFAECLAGKRCLITGGTRGIGRAVALRLAHLGAEVIIVGRDVVSGSAVVEEIRRNTGSGRARFIPADLAEMSEITRLAGQIAGLWSRFDLLINNAGASFGTRQVNSKGLEMTFAVNHLSYFALSLLLLPQLRAASGAARIINVASIAHRGVRLDFDNLQLERGYAGMHAYRCSKLANILFTRELARRVDPARVTVHALHPGFIATNIASYLRIWRWAIRFASSPDDGAETPVFLATEPSVTEFHGAYLQSCRPVKPSSAATDPVAARRLWDISLQLTGLPDLPG